MTRLTRITGKIFGETATSTGDDPQIGQFGSALVGTYVGTTDVATIQSLPAWSNGFIDAVTASNQYPPLPEMTGFGKVLSYQQNYLMQQGIPEWDGGTTYYMNNFCSKGAKIFYSLTDSNLNNDPEIDSINWKEFTSGGGNEIGDIVFRPLPTKDAGKHLLDGTLLDGSGSYAAFVQYIADLYTDDPTANYFETEANWQASVTQYGVCGKFVYDSINNTVRLPKITGFVEGTIDVSALGDLVEAGLPNITGRVVGNYGAGTYTGAFKLNSSHTISTSGGMGGQYEDFSFDASLSNPIYGNSNTVQPQSIKGFMYIVIANTSKTEIEVDIDEITTDLNGKADVDLTNVNNAGTSKGASWAMPSNTYDDLTLGAIGSNYTAPANGWFYLRKSKASGDYNQQYLMFWIQGGDPLSDKYAVQVQSTAQNDYCAIIAPVQKGDVCSVSYTFTGMTQYFRFIYAQGSESEA